MTAVRLALGGAVTRMRLALTDDPAPAVLVSYAYKNLCPDVAGLNVRDWVLDSGAFSAFHSGKEVVLEEFAAFALQKLRTDPRLVEVFSLDAIGDWRASMRNTERLWALGVPAIPCFHAGEPVDVLTSIARDYPKIALGGCVGLKKKQKHTWAAECFSRVWPKPIHGFGFGSFDVLKELPFHSVDASNWEAGPMRFGSWETFGNLSARIKDMNVRAEVDTYMRFEREAQFRWRKQMAELEVMMQPYRDAIDVARGNR